MDPVQLQILWQRLQIVMEEAAWAIKTTSLSSVVTEAFDFAALLYDPEGRLVVQNSDIAGKLGCRHTIVQAIYDESSGDMAPGDVFITNDPWIAEGHLYDVSVVRPIFYEDQIVAFSDCMAHVSDTGGSLNNTSRDVYEEGLFIPVQRICRGDVVDRHVSRFLAANFRNPQQSLGDIYGLIAGTKACETKVRHFLESNDLHDLSALSDEIIRRTEEAIRSEIRQRIPEGERFEYELVVDGFDQPNRVVVAIERAGDDLLIDFSGSAPESRIGINSTGNVTFAWTAYAVKSALCPWLPNNEGTFAPIDLRMDEGSVINPRHGAPVRMKAATSHIITSAILGALGRSGAIPAMAESGSPVRLLRFSGVQCDGSKISETLMLNGGMGGRDGLPGILAIAFPSNAANAPIEILEDRLPILVEERSIAWDSGGDGKAPGGSGQVFAFRVLPHEYLKVLVQSERIVHPAHGARGGETGTPVRCRSIPSPLVVCPGLP